MLCYYRNTTLVALATTIASGRVSGMDGSSSDERMTAF